MSTILGYVSDLFGNMFGSTGWIASVVSLVVAQPYLMIGLALMVAGSAIGFLSRLIRNT